MAPTAVLFKLTSINDTMNTTTTNKLSAYPAKSSAVNSVSLFGKYQDTAVGCELTIWTIVPLDISAEQYRKEMVLFFYFVVFFLSPPPFLLLLVTWPQRWQRISPYQPVQRNVKRSASLNQFGTLSSTSVICRELDSSISPGRQLRSRIIARQPLRFYPFVLVFWPVQLISDFPQQRCHSILPSDFRRV